VIIPVDLRSFIVKHCGLGVIGGILMELKLRTIRHVWESATAL